MPGAPETIYVDISGKCNLRCRYCIFFGDADASSHADLPTAEWRSFLEEAGRAGVFEIVFRGGEATMRDDLLELLHCTKANNMRFQLQTNGLRLTSDLAAELRKLNRCNLVRLSLDGRADRNDPVRGTGTHDNALRALELLRSNNLPCHVTATVHAFNCGALADSARYLLEELKIPVLGFSSVVDCVNPEYVLSPAAWAETLNTMIDVERQYSCQLTSSGMVGMLRRWRAMLHGAKTNSGSVVRHGCSRAGHALAVRNDGYYIVCSSLSARPLGRINRDALCGVWLHSGLLAEMRHEPSPDHALPCASCAWSAQCVGICPSLYRRGILSSAGTYCLKTFAENGGKVNLL